MSTPATTVDLSVKPTSVTYGAFTQTKQIKNEDGTVTNETSVKATMRESELEAAKKNSTLLFEQSFSYDLAGTVEGISQMGYSDEVILECFNNGLKAKIGRGIVAAMQDTDEQGNPTFQPVDGNFDAKVYGAEAAGRRGLTPVEKAMRDLKAALKNLPEDVAAGIFAQAFGGQKSPEASA